MDVGHRGANDDRFQSMNIPLKIAIGAILVIVLTGIFVVALPSLIGLLLTILILLAIYDFSRSVGANPCAHVQLSAAIGLSSTRRDRQDRCGVRPTGATSRAA